MVSDMPEIPQHSGTGQNEARRLNQLIDTALREPGEEHRRQIFQLGSRPNITAIAERIRRRATLLTRREHLPGQQIVSARDTLILTLYAGAAPKGWFSGWCDGSTRQTDQGCSSGIGGILTNTRGGEITQFTQYVGALPPFETEIAAAQTLLQSALQHGVERLRVHTDCRALLELWLKNRDDPRLATFRSLARCFKRMELDLVPRQHNHPANLLARSASINQG
jgi:ribonuclease HI